MSHLTGATISLALSFGSMSAPAQATGERAVATLDWHRSVAAEECLDAPALSASVEARLQRKVFVPSSQADMQIHVSLDSTGLGNWTAAIDLEDRNGTSLGHRELTIRAEHCAALDESLALMVLLMVDVTRDSVQPAAAKPTAPPVAALPQVLPPEKALAANNALPRWHSRAYLLGSVRDGQLPGFGLGTTLQGELRSLGGWSALASAAFWAPGERSEAGLGARFWLGTAEVNVCGPIHSSSSNEVSLCSGYQLGIVSARANRFDVNQHKSTLFHDLTLRLRASFWASASLGLHVALGAALPLVQDEFFGTRADGTVLRLMSRPILVPLADFGVAVRFDP